MYIPLSPPPHSSPQVRAHATELFSDASEASLAANGSGARQQQGQASAQQRATAAHAGRETGSVERARCCRLRSVRLRQTARWLRLPAASRANVKSLGESQVPMVSLSLPSPLRCLFRLPPPLSLSPSTRASVCPCLLPTVHDSLFPFLNRFSHSDSPPPSPTSSNPPVVSSQ